MRDYVDGPVTHQRGLPHLPGVPHLHVNRPIVWTATTRGILSHQLNFKPARLAERVWCTKVLSSLLNIYFRLFSSQAPSFLFTSATGRTGVHTAPKYGSNPIDMWRPTFEIGAAQFCCSVTEIAPLQPFLWVNRSLIQYHFLGGAKVIWCCMNIALKSLLTWLT